jgi:hypothetical protein
MAKQLIILAVFFISLLIFIRFTNIAIKQGWMKPLSPSANQTAAKNKKIMIIASTIAVGIILTVLIVFKK